MVLVFNLDEESGDSDATNAHIVGDKLNHITDNTVIKPTWTERSISEARHGTQRSEIINQGSFSAALACYPVISQVAQDLDLNSLDNLSRTCSLFRALLRPHRRSLIAVALRCSRDNRKRYGTNRANTQTELLDLANLTHRLSVTTCATDFVGECRRCGTVVCRNCIAKALPASKVARRHRRLCNVCIRAPLSALVAPHVDSAKTSFTYSAFAKSPCTCPMFFWLCQTCGHFLAHHDDEYHRIWTWRIRYSTYLGGLGTGIGEGYEGVKCGRGEDCLASRKFELEEDCSSDLTPDMPRDSYSRSMWQNDNPETPEHDLDRAGYFRQEVEGIGGLMRGKMKKMVIVGQTVQEHEDERENGDYLGREAKGLSRSWCSWCERVILSLKDEKRIIEAMDF